LPDEKIDKRIAVERASMFVRKLNPSGLPAEASAARQESRYAARELPNATSPALRYGLWWHQFVQRLHWQEQKESWNRIFDQQKRVSPDPTRSAREWKLLTNHLNEPENFRAEFAADDLVHSEMPFLWKIDDARCLEGVIDLAFFARDNGKCLILDWKTDRVPPDNAKTLRERYRPQLAAYWKAVSEIAKRDVEAAIYSTAAGELIRYTTAELTDEWSRLEKLPIEQFDAEIVTEFQRTPPAEPTAPVVSISSKTEQLELL
jgi:ATP-dependent exoDNAse (exonuclease V) beta subunit